MNELPLLRECDTCGRLTTELMLVRIERFTGYDLDGHRLTATEPKAICIDCCAGEVFFDPQPEMPG